MMHPGVLMQLVNNQSTSTVNCPAQLDADLHLYLQATCVLASQAGSQQPL
jgi:hypothetical protein